MSLLGSAPGYMGLPPVALDGPNDGILPEETASFRASTHACGNWVGSGVDLG